MKRIFLVFVLFLVAGLALFAAWAGVRASTSYAAAVHEAGGHPDVRVIESSFERGWMRSTAETSVEVHGQAGAAFRAWLEALGGEAVRPRVGFTMRHEFLHAPASTWSWIATGFAGSPILLESRTWVELDNESKLDAEPLLGKLPTLLISSRVRLGGSETDVYLPPGDAQAPGRVRLARWQHLDGLVRPQGQHLVAHGKLAGLEGGGETLEFRMLSLDWAIDSARGSRVPATVVVRIPQLALRHKVAGAPWIVVHDLEFGQTDAGSHGPNASMAYVRFVRAELDGAVYGPGRFEIVADAALADDGQPVAPEPDRAVQKVGHALDLLPGFVRQAPRAEFTRLFLNTPQGPMRGGGDLYLASSGSRGIERARLDLEAPVSMLETLRGAWMGESDAPAWYADWEDKGLLVRSGDSYRLRARVREGALTMNRVAAEEVFTFADEEEEEAAEEAEQVAEESSEEAVPAAGEAASEASEVVAEAEPADSESEAATAEVDPEPVGEPEAVAVDEAPAPEAVPNEAPPDPLPAAPAP